MTTDQLFISVVMLWAILMVVVLFKLHSVIERMKELNEDHGYIRSRLTSSRKRELKMLKLLERIVRAQTIWF